MNNKMKKAFVIGAILLFGTLNFGIDFRADEKSVVHTETYKVRAGDTFWNVSCRYRDLDERNLYIMEFMDEIRELNPWLKDAHCQINPGDLITVHYVTKE